MAIITKHAITSPWSDRISRLMLHDPTWKKMHPERILPPVNVSEDETHFQIELSIPGMDKEDVEIHLEKDILTITGDHQESVPNDKTSYTHQEFMHKSFHRAFNIPSSVEEDSIEAEYDKGLLKIKLHKKEVEVLAGKKKIEIK
ncbi:Hsp20/alpha crystallin family protein [uncultured Croceitalea sp.]|uniref:Hsp20/alpha crystallin family protein n=1 Tax=uncultured Croceitalea sp. TaxID=1798908 RepID=UPI0033061E56